MQIVNESDKDVTWWCYNSNDLIREGTLWEGKGNISAGGGRASYNPPSNETGFYYVQFTVIDGHWKPSNQWTYARCPRVPGDETLIFKGSCRYEVIVT
jgi:hypothetical protein